MEFILYNLPIFIIIVILCYLMIIDIKKSFCLYIDQNTSFLKELDKLLKENKQLNDELDQLEAEINKIKKENK